MGAVAARGVNQDQLLKDLRKQVEALEDDLRERSQEVPEFAEALDEEYQQARSAERTAATFETWREERVTQAAVGWVLGTVFVRFCEDNKLVEWPWFAGTGERLRIAEERHEAYFRDNLSHNDRDWIIAAFDHLAAANETAGGLFDRNHNALWGLTPGFEAASALLAFWRRRGEDGEVVHAFESDDWDTRFLGDLYQNLSEHARKTYALLQTPEFVEEFILDLTLEPAIEEFGLWPELSIEDGVRKVEHRGLRTIDPACGSGHFLLGLFERLLERYRAEAGAAVNDWACIRAALDAVHGCDKNPFAVSVARFRLLVAVLKAAEVKRLDAAPTFPINIAVGDSLLHGRGVGKRKQKGKSQDDLFSGLDDADEAADAREDEGAFAYVTEDVNEFVRSSDLLGKHSYHVVVANPPYITVKDKQENDNYRDIYDACSGKYALSVPFAQRIFELATRQDGGFTGQITSNSFMKREFGKKLIEEFFRTKVKLTHVIDTSGAFIPGHGTPTVILAGRNTERGWADPIRAVLGVRGEPGQPETAADGVVWRAILDQVGKPGSDSEYISVEDVPRGDFGVFPWSLSGGGSSEVLALLDGNKNRLAGQLERAIGFASFPGQDDVFFFPPSWFKKGTFPDSIRRPLITGEVVRDWGEWCVEDALAPYDMRQRPQVLDDSSFWGRHLWLNRTLLGSTVSFGGETRSATGEPWWTWYRWVPERYRTPLSITFAFVATHNHFVLDRGGKVFKQSAPVIKLPEGATEDEHLALLGVLNSSTACFWMKQVCHDKGIRGEGGGFTSDDWERFFEFTGTKLQGFPLPAALPLDLGRALDALAQELAGNEPSVIAASPAVPTRDAFDAAHSAHAAIHRTMIALQEELDWQIYGDYKLVSDSEVDFLTADDAKDIPEVALGERAFEIVLARKVAAGETETAWFERHNSTPVTQIPAHWPAAYREIVQRRIDVIISRRDIALIERPECKRRWSSPTWEKKEAEALRTWLLDRCRAVARSGDLVNSLVSVPCPG
jgi:hypothetical protein